MKVILFTIAMLIAGPIFAASDVKITSFKFLDHSSHFTPGAEICGEVVAPTGKPEMIKIVSDPSSKNPGRYYTWAGPEGKFCSIIATYTGLAEAELQK